MRRIAIMGGGFGLYGHCQSILDRQWGAVVLERRFRERFVARKELCHYADEIEWVDSVVDAFPGLTACVLALPPESQMAAAMTCLKSPFRFALGLEKPLSCNPELARSLLTDLCESGRSFRVNYSFIYSRWYEILSVHLRQSPTSIEVQWFFKAHHHRVAGTTWKDRHSLGGGALRFYGIHLIAVAARLGYAQVLSVRIGGRGHDRCERWSATFVGPDLPDMTVSVDDDAMEDRFEVRELSGSLGDAGGTILRAKDPFAWEPAVSGRDVRCTILDRFHDDLDKGKLGVGDTEWYARVLSLWQEMERHAVWDGWK